MKQYQRLLEMEGVALTVAEEALSAIARKAIDRKTGARGLRSIMEAILLDTMFDLPSLEGIEEVMISRQVVEGTRWSKMTPKQRRRWSRRMHRLRWHKPGVTRAAAHAADAEHASSRL